MPLPFASPTAFWRGRVVGQVTNFLVLLRKVRFHLECIFYLQSLKQETTIDFHKKGKLPALWNFRSVKSCSSNITRIVLPDQNLICPQSQSAVKCWSIFQVRASKRFFKYPWYTVVRINNPPGLNAFFKLSIKCLDRINVQSLHMRL